jgi:hypothetical protein
MKSRLFSYIIVLVLFLVLGVGAARADYGNANSQPQVPLGTGFTYQGQLKDSAGNPISDSCDFRFILYNTEFGGAQVGPLQEKTTVSVVDGYFTVGLDFGSSAFLGEARWLSVAVRCPAGSGTFTTLSPLQALTATPYAIYSSNAPWGGLSGVPAGFADSIDNDTLYTAGNGLILTNTQLSVDFAGSGSADTVARSDHTHWGETWTGAGIGLNLYSNYAGIVGAGSEYGVGGTSGSPTGTGGYFTNYSGSGGDRGWGVRSFTGSGIPEDVHPGGWLYNAAGEFAGPNGLIGAASSDVSTGFGVTGISAATSGIGVRGDASATSGINFGIYGSSASGTGTGVYGYTSSGTGPTYGVYGASKSGNGKGVYGYASNTTGDTYGVSGRSDSTDGIGVYGYTGVFTGTATGVSGYTNSLSGFGVKGWSGYSGTSSGVYGRGDSNTGFGVVGYNYWYGAGVGAWSYGGNLIEAYAGDYPHGTRRFYIDLYGNVYADGTYNSFMTSSLDGETHATSSVQSTEAWLEDFGHSDLVNGIATVTIAPDFVGVTNLSVDYMVFVSLEGDCQGVYITNKTPTTFEVHELNGGTSNVPFGYRIVVKPAGSETTRLPVVTIPATVEVPRQPDDASQPVTPPQPPPSPVEQGQLPD